MRKPTLLFAAFALAAFVPLAFPGLSAAAQDGAPDEIFLRVGHFANQAGPVNVSFDGLPLDEAQNLAFGAMTPWLEVSAGTYPISVLLVDVPDAPPLVTADVLLEAGGWYTLALIGEADENTVRLQTIREQNNALANGETRITLFNAMPDSVPINLQLADGTLLIGALGYPSDLLASDGTYTVDIVAGPRSIEVTPFDARDQVLFGLPDLYLAPGRHHFLVAGGWASHPLSFLFVTDPATMDSHDANGENGLADVGVGAARARAAHLIPGLSAVDIYINGEPGDETLALAYATVSPWFELSAGFYDFVVVPAGAGPDAALFTAEDVPIVAGDWVTLAAMGDFTHETLAIHPVVENYSPIAPGETRVTLFNAILDSTPVSLQLSDGTLLIGGVAYPNPASGESGARSVDIVAGARNLQVTPFDDPSSVLLELSDLQLAEGHENFIALTGFKSNVVPALVATPLH